MIWVMPLLAIAGRRIAKVHAADLERRSENVRGSVEGHTVSPAHCERFVVIADMRSSRPELVSPRFRVRSDETLELRRQHIEFCTGENRRHHNETIVLEGPHQLVRQRAATTCDLVSSVHADLEAHCGMMAQRLDRRPASPIAGSAPIAVWSAAKHRG